MIIYQYPIITRLKIVLSLFFIKLNINEIDAICEYTGYLQFQETHVLGSK